MDKGQTVALLGDKGCGKSALIKLLQRIYDPQIGKVSLKLLYSFVVLNDTRESWVTSTGSNLSTLKRCLVSGV